MQKLLIILVVIVPLAAAAAGIQVSPSKLRLEAGAGRPTATQLVVSNPTADVQLFEVYPDDFAEVITAEPASFTLEAGTQKSVKIAVDSKKLKNDEIRTTNISVLAKPLAESRFQANSGVKIPLTITVIKPSSKLPSIRWAEYLSLITLATAIAGYTILRMKRNKTSPPTAKETTDS